ncbi:MAG: uroporphyrinogen decarboxylase family protein [bacterium]
MTPRERLLTVINGGIPDCVPVAPDFSNMIPAKMTGKPFWDLYLYNDPPIWEAYIDCAKYFNIDSVMDGYFPFQYPTPPGDGEPWEQFIILKNEEKIVTQWSRIEDGQRVWMPYVDTFPVADPPTCHVHCEKLAYPDIPTWYEPVTGIKPVNLGPEGLKHVKELMGDQGLVGIFLTCSSVLGNDEAIYDYYDYPEKYEQLAIDRVKQVEERFAYIMSLDVKPDFLCVGGSGTLVFQTVDIFRRIALPAVKRAIELATAAGIPTQIHSCGPEKELVKIMAEETTLTVIDPLEIPPMGDCNLKELKRLYGDKITLKGNLHTTDVMLRGTVDDVIKAAKQAIDDGAANGRFILSTGDQCGRDTPFENLHAMIETARTYGRY